MAILAPIVHCAAVPRFTGFPSGSPPLAVRIRCDLSPLQLLPPCNVCDRPSRHYLDNRRSNAVGAVRRVVLPRNVARGKSRTRGRREGELDGLGASGRYPPGRELPPCFIPRPNELTSTPRGSLRHFAACLAATSPHRVHKPTFLASSFRPLATLSPARYKLTPLK